MSLWWFLFGLFVSVSFRFLWLYRRHGERQAYHDQAWDSTQEIVSMIEIWVPCSAVRWLNNIFPQRRLQSSAETVFARWKSWAQWDSISIITEKAIWVGSFKVFIDQRRLKCDSLFRSWTLHVRNVVIRLEGSWKTHKELTFRRWEGSVRTMNQTIN